MALLKFMEVPHGQLQDVGLFQFGDILPLGLECHRHDVLQLIQAFINTSATLAFEQRFHDLEITNVYHENNDTSRS